MKEGCISVIIPIYNTPPDTLRQCLDSILSQSYNNIEIICVDDCSKNVGTLMVEKEISSENKSLINLIQLDNNSGAASARNLGLSIAEGEYCIFLDSDDVFSKELLKSLYETIIKNSSDICICGYTIAVEDGSKLNEISKIAVVDNFESIEGRDEMLIRIPASGCNRLCKTEYLRKNNIFFQNLKSDNDLYFAIKSVLCTKNVAMLSSSDLFYYRFNTEYQISAGINPMNMLVAIEKLMSEHYPVYTNAKKMILNYAIITGVYEMKMCKNDEDTHNFYDIFRDKYLETDIDRLQTKRTQPYITAWKSLEWSAKWYLLYDCFFEQLSEKKDGLIASLKNYKNILVWGRGKRGGAFEKWCRINGVTISGICDKNNKDINTIDDYGNAVLDVELIEEFEFDLIIATNRAIFTYLKNKYEIDVMDLEQFCPY